MKKAVLLIVDVQEALVVEGLCEKETMLASIRRLMDAAYGQGLEIIYVRHDGGKGDLEKNTPGWEIYHEIAPKHGELIIDKRRNSAFKDTRLHETLRAKGIDTVVLCGMQTEYCIDATCKSAFDLGYKLIIPKGTTSTFDNCYFPGNKLKQYFEEKIWDGRFAEVLPVEEAVRRMQGTTPS